MKALIHVNHLLGTGHAYRACRMGAALSKQGGVVTLASGNTLPETLDTSSFTVRMLPIAKSLDHGFTALAQENGEPVDEIWRVRRAEAFYALWEEIDPDILITEHFPFGRRKLSFELLPVLKAMRLKKPEGLIAASIRDILVRKEQLEKEQLMADIAAEFYDVVVVHSDPKFVRLEDSFRYVDAVRDLIRYTGFLHDASATADMSVKKTNEVIVSAGGGAFGLKLLQTAVAARALSTNTRDLQWRILVGHNIDQNSYETLQVESPMGVIVERNRSDFKELLAGARVSVSQAGYNSVLDILSANIPAVLVPSNVNGNEQTDRAGILANQGVVQMLAEDELSATTLAETVDKAFRIGSGTIHVQIDNGDVCAKALLDAFDDKQKRIEAR
ncbi:MAG: glycosyltransferase [Stappiaceae bacterium]